MSASGDRRLSEWCSAHAWAVTTEGECNGQPENEALRFALYDSNEDGPAIALFESREDAERVAEALIRFGRTAPSTERGGCVRDMVEYALRQPLIDGEIVVPLPRSPDEIPGDFKIELKLDRAAISRIVLGGLPPTTDS